MEDCLFCGIVQGNVPAEVVYQDDLCVAFRDIHPQAPVHVLIIPRLHKSSLADTDPENENLLGHLLFVCRQVAQSEGIAQSGYRVVTNHGRHGAQSVGHLHLHLLGGRQMDGSMG